MSTEQVGEQRYQLRFSLVQEGRTAESVEPSRDEVQLFVNASLGLLTGGCELCQFAHLNSSPAMFCEKKKTPVNWGSPRCEYFVRNPAQAPDLYGK